MDQRLASTEERMQRSEAAGHNTKWLSTTGHPPQGAASISKEAQGSTAVGHRAQRLTGYWEAGAGGVRSSRKKTGSLAGSGPTVRSGRAAGSFTVAGLTILCLAAGWFTAGLLAIVHETDTILIPAGKAEDISTAHICRAEGIGRGERNMTGISEGSQVVVSRAGVGASHSEVLWAGCG